METSFCSLATLSEGPKLASVLEAWMKHLERHAPGESIG